MSSKVKAAGKSRANQPGEMGNMAIYQLGSLWRIGERYQETGQVGNTGILPMQWAAESESLKDSDGILCGTMAESLMIWLSLLD